MKNIRLLLFTLLCASQLYGMELPSKEQLPPELYTEIIRKAVETSNTLEEAVKAVNAASALQGAKYENLKDFTRLVHILANKFNASTEEVANLFGTKTAQHYLYLGKKVQNIVFNSKGRIGEHVDEVNKLIAEGADVNYVAQSGMTALIQAAMSLNPYMVELLLNHGSDPHYVHPFQDRALDLIKRISRYQSSREITNIISMLEEAMTKKQQQ